MAGEPGGGDRQRPTPAEIQARITARQIRNTGSNAEQTGSGSSGGLSGGQADMGGEGAGLDAASARKTVLKPMRWDDHGLVSSDEESRSEPDQPAAGEGVTGLVSGGEQGLAPTAGQDSETGPRAELGEVPQRVVPAAAAEAGERIMPKDRWGFLAGLKPHMPGWFKKERAAPVRVEPAVSSPAAVAQPEAATDLGPPPPFPGRQDSSVEAGPEAGVQPEPGAAGQQSAQEPSAAAQPQEAQASAAAPEPGATEQLSSPEKPPLDLSQPVEVNGTQEDLQATGERIVAALKASGSADVPISFKGTPGDLGTLRQLLVEAGITPKSQSKPVIRDGILSVTATFSPPVAPVSQAPAAAGPTEGVDQSEPAAPAATGAITPDAEALLQSIDAGGVAAFMTENLKKIAAANSIAFTDNSTPNSIIDALRVKKAAFAETPAGEPAQSAEGDADAAERERRRGELEEELYQSIGDISGEDFSRGVARRLINNALELAVLGLGERRPLLVQENLQTSIANALDNAPDTSPRVMIGNVIFDQIEEALSDNNRARVEALISAVQLLGLDQNNKVVGLESDTLEALRRSLNSGE